MIQIKQSQTADTRTCELGHDMTPPPSLTEAIKRVRAFGPSFAATSGSAEGRHG